MKPVYLKNIVTFQTNILIVSKLIGIKLDWNISDFYAEKRSLDSQGGNGFGLNISVRNKLVSDGRADITNDTNTSRSQ